MRSNLVSTFHLNGHALGFIADPQTQSWNQLVQHNKHYHRKLLLDNIHWNGHTFGFLPQASKVRTYLYNVINITTGKHCLIASI